MKLGVINSFLIVCFYIMAIKQHLWKNALNIQSIQEKILPIIFHAIRSTKHFVDQLSANYNGYYMQGSGKSDKYGFSGACLIWTP